MQELQNLVWKSGVTCRSNSLVHEGSDRVALVGPWHPAKVKPPELPVLFEQSQLEMLEKKKKIISFIAH